MSAGRVSIAGLTLVALLCLTCGEDRSTGPCGNGGPTASFAVTPPSGTTGTVFAFDASGSSDAEDEVSELQVRWDWENDGWDTDWSTTKTASHQYSSPGNKTVKLEVRDTGSLTDGATRVVVVSSVSLPTMVSVPAGTFVMGDYGAYCGTSEHQVTLTHSFYLGKYEVTNGEYRDAVQWAYDHGYVTVTSDAVRDKLDGSAVLLVNLASPYCQLSFSGGVFSVAPRKDSYPMVEVNWYGAAAYCDWLSLEEGLARAYDHSTWQCNSGDPYGAAGYRLPTDAEWEYAAQYNDGRRYPWGDEEPECRRGNYPDFCQQTACLGSTSPVGIYESGKSALGLYDVAGNVAEWCNDWHACDLGAAQVCDPVGPSESTGTRVLRGGSWGGCAYEWCLLCASRDSKPPAVPTAVGGFRCARSEL